MARNWVWIAGGGAILLLGVGIALFPRPDGAALEPGPVMAETPLVAAPIADLANVPEGAAPTAAEPELTRAMAMAPAQIVMVPGVEVVARELNSPSGSVERDLILMQELFDRYRRYQDGAAPEGNLNEEITEQLRGLNPKGLAVLPADLPALDKGGKLLDRWGTPYEFHAEGNADIQVRSAGPDRRLWTEDDAISDGGPPAL